MRFKCVQSEFREMRTDSFVPELVNGLYGNTKRRKIYPERRNGLFHSVSCAGIAVLVWNLFVNDRQGLKKRYDNRSI